MKCHCPGSKGRAENRCTGFQRGIRLSVVARTTNAPMGSGHQRQSIPVDQQLSFSTLLLVVTNEEMSELCQIRSGPSEQIRSDPGCTTVQIMFLPREENSHCCCLICLFGDCLRKFSMQWCYGMQTIQPFWWEYQQMLGRDVPCCSTLTSRELWCLARNGCLSLRPRKRSHHSKQEERSQQTSTTSDERNSDCQKWDLGSLRVHLRPQRHVVGTCWQYCERSPTTTGSYQLCEKITQWPQGVHG